MAPAKGWQDLDCDDLRLLSCEQFVSLACKAENRVILLLGMWPPTDIGIATRHGLLWQWREKQTVTLEGKTYDVLAISPTFDKPLGNLEVMEVHVPVWGKGTGGEDVFTVDYRDTSNKFWPMVEKYRPIAIMSFSRWTISKEWSLDEWATNWRRSAWFLEIPYVDEEGNETPHVLERPFVGGSAGDPAPPSQGHSSITGSPPDPTKPAADPPAAMAEPPAASRRYSNLPMNEIIAAIQGTTPAIDVEPLKNTAQGPGRYVSNFMAYHVAWYREWWNAETDDDDLKCLFSGHTHVGEQVEVVEAEKAIGIQLKELFKVLPATEGG